MKLLLLPGMDGTGDLFGPLLAALPPDLPAVVVPFPEDRPLGYDELMTLVLDAAPEDDDYVVVGESFSGPLALRLAARRPPRLKGVILSASFARSPLPKLLRPLRHLVGGWMFNRLAIPLGVRLMLGRYWTRDVAALASSSIRRVKPAVMAARLRAAMAVDAEDALRTCLVPVLVLRGKSDWLVRRRSWRHVRRLNPNAEAVKIDAAHILLAAAPADGARAIMAFARALA